MKMQNRGGWVVAGVGGGLPCIIDPRGYYQAPPPRRQKGRVSGLGGLR